MCPFYSYPTPLRNLKTKKVTFSCARLEMNPQKALTNMATIRIRFRPYVSPNVPQMYPPISMPENNDHLIEQGLVGFTGVAFYR